jgi:hypothetical protein
MKLKFTLKLMLALGLLQFCSAAVAAEPQATASAMQFTESGLVLAMLALVLGFTVVARRSPNAEKPLADSGDAPASEPALTSNKATVHKLVVPNAREPLDESLSRTAS